MDFNAIAQWIGTNSMAQEPESTTDMWNSMQTDTEAKGGPGAENVARKAIYHYLKERDVEDDVEMAYKRVSCKSQQIEAFSRRNSTVNLENLESSTLYDNSGYVTEEPELPAIEIHDSYAVSIPVRHAV